MPESITVEISPLRPKPGIIQRMRLLKVIAILVIGPLLGVVGGFIVGGLLLPSDPAPGDSFLVIICAAIGFSVSIAASVMLADWSWRHSVNLKTRPNASEVPPRNC